MSNTCWRGRKEAVLPRVANRAERVAADAGKSISDEVAAHRVSPYVLCTSERWAPAARRESFVGAGSVEGHTAGAASVHPLDQRCQSGGASEEEHGAHREGC